MKSLLFSMLVALAIPFAAPTAHAATQYFTVGSTATVTSGNGSWLTTGNNWAAGAAPTVWNNGGTTVAVFATTGAASSASVNTNAGGTDVSVDSITITVGAGIAPGSIFFNNTGFILSAASPQTLSIVTSGGSIITIAAGKTASIGNNVTVASTDTLGNSETISLGAASVLNVEAGGTLTKTQAGTTRQFILNGGTVNVAGTVSYNPASNDNGQLVIGQASATTVNVTSGGVFSSSSDGTGNSLGSIELNNNGATPATLNIGTGGSVIISNTVSNQAGLSINRGNAANGSSGTVNLNGGTLTVPRIFQGTIPGGTVTAPTNATTSGTLNFNGGTLTTNVTNNTNFLGGLTTANVRGTTTANSGANINNAGFNITVAQALLHSGITGDPAVDGGLAEFGTGNLTLTGVNTYTGATVVSATGTLTLGGASTINATSGVTINGPSAKFMQLSSAGMTATVPITLTQGTLGGTGSVGAVSVGAGTGGIIANGNSNSTALTLGSLSFAGGASLNLNMVGGASTTTPALIDSGNLSTSAGVHNGEIVVNFSGGALTPLSTYELASYAGTLTGLTAADFSIGTGISPRAIGTSTFSLATANQLKFTLGSIDTLVWVGTGNVGGNNNWITGVTNSSPSANAAWVLKNGHTVTDYWAGDIVEFDDAPVTGPSGPLTPSNTANISGASVTPGSITFNNNTAAYTITSDSPTHGIVGNTSITLAGAGSVTLSEPNTYTGATQINNGTLQLVSGSLATTAINVASTGAFTEDAASTVSGGASISSTGSTTLSGANTFTGTTGVNGGTLTLNGTINASAVTVAAAGTFNESNTGALQSAATLTTSGASTLGGLNTFAGATTVNGGTLALNGTINASAVTVTAGNLAESTGGALQGLSSLTVNNTATLAGINTNTAGISIGAAGTLQLQANSTNSALGASSVIATQNFTQPQMPSGMTLQLRADNSVASGGIVAFDGGATTFGVNGSGARLSGVLNFDVNQLTGAGSNLVLQLGSPTAVWNIGNTTLPTTTINVTGGNGYSLQLGALTVGNAESLILNASGANLIINAITNSTPSPGSVTLTGANTVILTGSDTSTGATTISAGTLQVGNGSTTGNITTASSIVDNATLAFDRSNTVTEGVDFPNAINGTAGNLTQLGSGNLILNTVNGYTGATLVSAGTLTVADPGSINGSTGVTITGGAKFVQTSTVAGTVPITVTNGTLDGTGTVGTVSVAAAGIIANGAGTTATLSVGSVTFTGASGVMNLALVGGATTSTFSVADAGAFTTPNSGAHEIVVNFSGGTLTPGSTYNLISYLNGSFTGGASDFGIGTGVSPRAIATSSFNVGGGVVSFTLGTADTLVWVGTGNGTGNGNWITGVTNSSPSAGASWVTKNGHATTDYWAGDIVEFDDAPVTGPSGPITPSTTANITGASVTPGSITFNNNTLAYTITSDSPSHGIVGNTSITLAGAGSVTLSERNSYTGATSVGSGTLHLVSGSLAGTPISVGGAGTFTEDSASTIGGAASVTNAGTTTLSGVNTYTGATAANGGTLSLVGGSLAGTAITVGGAGTFTEDSASTISGASSLSSGNTTNLAGANTYTGATTVTAGITTLTGTMSASAVTVNSLASFNEPTGGSLQGTASLFTNGTATLAGINTNTGGLGVGTTGTLQLQANAANTSSGVSSVMATQNMSNAQLVAGSVIQLRADTSIAAGAGGGVVSFDSGATQFGINLFGQHITNGTYNFDVNSLTSGANTTLAFASNATWITGDSAALPVNFNITGGSGYSLQLGNLLPGSNSSLEFNTTTANLILGSINNPAVGSTGTVTKDGAGTLSLLGVDNSTGATVINNGTMKLNTAGTTGGGTAGGSIVGSTSIAVNTGGTLLLNAHDAVGTVSAVNLNGGTLNAGTFAEGGHVANTSLTAGMGNLTLSGASTIDFGATSTSTDLVFTGGVGNSGYTLNIYDYSGGAYVPGGIDDGTTNIQDRLLFVNDPTFGALGTAIPAINFYSGNGTGFIGSGQEIAFGSGFEVVAIAAVPEPTTILGALALLGLVGYRERKRFATLLRRAS